MTERLIERDRSAFHDGANYYVPACAYASRLVHGRQGMFSLGIPAAPDDDIVDTDIDADAVAGTVTAQDYTSDSPYGRTLTLTPSGDPGAAGGVIDVYGLDYLNQPMIERFTGANGSTAVLYGKKAFYKVTKTVIVTPATNAITYKLGRGYRLGLPFRGDVVFAREDGVNVKAENRTVTLSVQFSDADATAGMSKFVRSPVNGYISAIRGLPDGAGSTNNPGITIELGGVAVTGLALTIDSDTTTVVSDTPTTAGYSANNRVRAGDTIEVIGSAAASAGSYIVEIDIVPVQCLAPDETDPATAITGDPRGTYEANMTLDGVKEIIVGILGNGLTNASGNGGLYGIRHFAG